MLEVPENVRCTCINRHARSGSAPGGLRRIVIYGWQIITIVENLIGQKRIRPIALALCKTAESIAVCNRIRRFGCNLKLAAA